MVFNKNVERRDIEQFENENLENICSSSLFTSLKNELMKKHLSFEVKVQHAESDLNKYLSHFVIDIFNEKGERACEHDEPNCCLMLCGTICFMRNGRIVGVNLHTDKEFIEELELLIEQIKKYA